jgi:hypothetical protein
MNQRIVFSILSIVILNACSDPRAANIGNIKHAINDYLKSERSCIASSTFTMPAQIRINEKKEQVILDHLVQAGLLTKSKKFEKIRANSIWAAMGSSGSKEEQIYKYELTDIGKQNYKTESNPLSMGTDGEFCYGYSQVDTIESYTEPADFLGKKVIEVSFTYKLAEHTKWIEADIFKTYRSVVQTLESERTPLKGKPSLVLPNKGWTHPNMP